MHLRESTGNLTRRSGLESTDGRRPWIERSGLGVHLRESTGNLTRRSGLGVRAAAVDREVRTRSALKEVNREPDKEVWTRSQQTDGGRG